MKIVGMALNDWSALVDPIPTRSQPSIPHTSLHLETCFPVHITRTSLSPPFSSPWHTLEPKQRPEGRSHHRRQIIKVLILRSAKGHLPLTLAGNRPQGIQPRKGSSRKRATRRAERNRPHPTTPSPQVRLSSLVLYGSQVNFGSTGSASACQEQRSQTQAINRTRARGRPRPRPRPEATADITSTPYRRRIWRASDWQRRPQTH